jgi:hypothetical protein
VIFQAVFVEQPKDIERVIFDPGQERIRRPIEELEGGDVLAKKAMLDQCIDGFRVVHQPLWAGEIECREEVANAVGASERATDHMVEGQACFPVVDEVKKCAVKRATDVCWDGWTAEVTVNRIH